MGQRDRFHSCQLSGQTSQRDGTGDWALQLGGAMNLQCCQRVGASFTFPMQSSVSVVHGSASVSPDPSEIFTTLCLVYERLLVSLLVRESEIGTFMSPS